MHAPRTAREETAQQIARCVLMDRELEHERLTLRRECELQRRALRRVTSRVDAAPRRR
jgi:hypothetical protein